MSSNFIKVGTLLNLDLSEMRGLKKNLNLIFEDGVRVNNASYKHIILYRYLINFQPLIGFRLVSDTWVGNYLVNGFFTNGTYLGVYSAIFKQLAKDETVNLTNDLKLKLFKVMYETIDLVNRDLVSNIIEYTLGAEIRDILDIQFNDKLMESIANASRDNSKHAIDNTYSVLDNIIRDEKYNGNPIKQFYLSKAVSVDQIKQLLGSRGFITEMNSKIFNIPMTNSFALGFKNIYEAAIESRAGAKALYLSSKAIQDSEYLARELQLIVMFIKKVYRGDCGHAKYIDFFIRKEEYDDKGYLVQKSDLHNLKGKRYLDVDNVEKIIEGNEKHLEGTYIKLRMATYCGYKDKNAICSACVGEISGSILDHQNLGHIMATVASSGMSQALLSTKHLLKSAISAAIRLDSIVSKYMILKKHDRLLFKTGVLNKKVKKVYLKFKQREAWGLSNAMNSKDLFSINISKISRLSSAILVIESSKDVVEIELPLKYGSRYAFFTIDMLSHIIKNGYATVDEEYFMVDINNFDNKRPVFMYEKVEFDFAALIKEFKSLLKTRKYKQVGDRYKSEFAPHVLVQKIFELINNKLDVNIALLEVLVYAFTVQDLTKRNFDLGRNAASRDVVGFREVIDYRSLGASYDWDNLQNKVLNPVLHLEDNKCSHPMDVFFRPNEVLEELKEKEKLINA